MTEDLTPILKYLLLQAITNSEQVTAMRIALEDAGILTPEVKAFAMARSKQFWKVRRERFEGIGASEQDLLLRFLKDFEGPAQ